MLGGGLLHRRGRRLGDQGRAQAGEDRQVRPYRLQPYGSEDRVHPACIGDVLIRTIEGPAGPFLLFMRVRLRNRSTAIGVPAHGTASTAVIDDARCSRRPPGDGAAGRIHCPDVTRRRRGGPSRLAPAASGIGVPSCARTYGSRADGRNRRNGKHAGCRRFGSSRAGQPAPQNGKQQPTAPGRVGTGAYRRIRGDFR